MALFTRKPPPGLVHQSDRGSQYTSYEFGKTLRTSGLLASMGRVGRVGLRQRDDRIVLRHPEGRTGLPAALADPARAGNAQKLHARG
jgi:transposase InsO family protein